MIFEIVSAIQNIETIAEGSSIRVRHLLIRKYREGPLEEEKRYRYC